MTRMVSTRLACVVAVMLMASGGAAAPSLAQSPPDATIVFPAGLACAGFDLQVDIWANPHPVFREFYDKNGNLVRTLGAGKGNTLVFTNLTTQETLSLRSNGAVGRTTFNADGSQTQSLTGHNVLIFYPTDVPAGPSTTLYVGQVVYTVDLNAVFTLQSVSGTATDICAALSQ